MSISEHAKKAALDIIMQQKPIKILQSEKPVNVAPRKKSKILEPDTQIMVTPNSPATIIHETNVIGGIDEIVVISPIDTFGVYVEADGDTLLDKTYNQIKGLSSQGKYLTAFQDVDGSYVLNIGEFMTWNEYIKIMLKSMATQFTFNQVYAKYYIYE